MTETREDEIRPLGTPASPAPVPALFRDVIESFVIAVIIAMVVKHIVGEAYKVPTGSMEPTIHGSVADGDHILVNKLARIRDPRRWEIWVFQYPLNRRINYVKRVVGVGPETLRIAGGDLWTSPFGTAERGAAELFDSGELVIARKPDVLRDACFERYPQVHPEAVALGDAETFAEFWFTPRSDIDDDSSFAFADDGLRIRSESRTWAHFRNAIKDRMDLWEPVSPGNGDGVHDVGDLRLDLRLRPEGEGGRVILQIRDCELAEFIEARLPFGTNEEEGGIFLGDRRLDDLGDFRLAPGGEVRLSFASADDRITLRADDREVARIDFRHEPLATFGTIRWPARVSFGIERGAALFREAQVYRDIYYRGGGGRPRSIFDESYESCCVDIPADHYYVLGDNSPSSHDSREWRRKTITLGEDGPSYSGDVMAIVDPERLEERRDNPYTLQIDGERRTWFVDEFGNNREIPEWDLPGPRSWSELPAPLVPGKLLVGRAFAVFLPPKRMRLVR